jgi:hypothetical protein
MRSWQVPMYASWSLTFALLGDTFLYTFLPVHASSVHIPVVWIGVLLSINRFVRIVITPWMALLFHQFGFRNLSIGRRYWRSFPRLATALDGEWPDG